MIGTVYDLLPEGQDNAISRRGLAMTIGISERQLRRTIHNERLAGKPICTAPGGGYYRPHTAEEVNSWATRMEHRGKAVLAAAAAVRAESGM